MIALADDKPAAAPGAAGAAKGRSPTSTFLLFASFAAVLIILFNPGLRVTLGQWAGYVLDPTIGFGHRRPILTILVGSMILVVGTTAIRHFLIDWVNMARVQDAMRAFQKELGEARKANNTYKLKKLTDAQPEVMALQADMSTEQMKPMAFTMLLVIPIFAWLSIFVLTPTAVHLVSAPPAQPVIMAGVMNEQFAHAATLPSAQEDVSESHSFDLYAVLPPNGTAPSGFATYQVDRTHATYAVPLAGAPAIPAAARVATLQAGSYTVGFVAPNATTRLTVATASQNVTATAALVVVVNGSAVDQAFVVTTSAPVTFTATANETAYAVVPNDIGGNASGAAQLSFTGPGSFFAPLTPANVLTLDRAQSAHVVPSAVKVPWDRNWDSTDNTDPPAHHWYLLGIFPRWIVLYSLFGIPFGQIAQRALKLWEFRHHEVELTAPPPQGA